MWLEDGGFGTRFAYAHELQCRLDGWQASLTLAIGPNTLLLRRARSTPRRAVVIRAWEHAAFGQRFSSAPL